MRFQGKHRLGLSSSLFEMMLLLFLRLFHLLWSYSSLENGLGRGRTVIAKAKVSYGGKRLVQAVMLYSLLTFFWLLSYSLPTTRAIFFFTSLYRSQ